MPSITIVNNEFITVEYWEEKKIIRHTIHKHIDDQTFKVALNAGTEVLARYGAAKWLSDDRKNGPLSDQIGQWAFTDWAPRTIAAGWQFWANVVPKEIAAADTLGPIIHAFSEKGLRMMLFSQVEDAIEWLDRMEAAQPVDRLS